MADLTPPPSQNNTPLRPAVQPKKPTEPPLSPTLSNSGTLPPSNPITDLSTSESGPSFDRGEAEMEVMDYSTDEESEEEEGEDIEEGMQIEGGEEGPADIAEDIEEDEPLAGGAGAEIGAGTGVEGVKTGGAKRKARPGRGKGAKGKGKAPATPGGGRAPRSGGGPKARKDGELYETEIVNRWNFEFGDPCQIQQTKS